MKSIYSCQKCTKLLNDALLGLNSDKQHDLQTAMQDMKWQQNCNSDKGNHKYNIKIQTPTWPALQLTKGRLLEFRLGHIYPPPPPLKEGLLNLLVTF